MPFVSPKTLAFHQLLLSVAVFVAGSGILIGSAAAQPGYAITHPDAQSFEHASLLGPDVLSGVDAPIPLSDLEPCTDCCPPARWPRQASAFANVDPLPESYSYFCGCPDPYRFHYGAKARMYYMNDQRMEFTGQESTFGVEGVLAGGVEQQVGEWQWGGDGEFFLNQPFDRNILIDSPIRRSFARNFDVDILQISQLYASARRGDIYLAAGRFVTPFGRYYYPTYFNNFWDSPFIRSEAILYRETGVLAQWDPGRFVFTAALTNGGFDRDANSSKALVARAGIEEENYAFGASIKTQDGIGSEHQKTYNNHVGVDAMVRSGRWTLSGEAIYDEYGIREPGTNLDDIFWGRSYYWREYNNAFHVPMTGFGYYVDLGYRGERWSFNLNYGDYYPQQEVGMPAHDTAIHRGLLHLAYDITPHWRTYGILLLENDALIPIGTDRKRIGMSYAAGLQLTL
jgi:hypothetical protein